MEGRIPNRKALFDVGAAGPLAGLVFTIPALIIGLKLSRVIETTETTPYMIYLGESFLFSQLSKLIIGELPQNYDVVLHPVAFAGWAGLFVTALNLLPIGQLDGGHILYAIFGEKSKHVYKFFLGVFIIICAIWYQGWILLIILLILFGYRHPPPTDDYTPLDNKRRLIGYFIFAIFLMSFTPVPFYFVE
jgi:membrane-associated protease RseP (regulator of RpoE activity)